MNNVEVSGETVNINGTTYYKGNGTYQLATADNTADYPDLIKVYSLTLPEGVTADGTYRSCQAG